MAALLPGSLAKDRKGKEKKKKEKKKCTRRVACHKEAKLSSTNRTENSILQNQKSLLENKTHG